MEARPRPRHRRADRLRRLAAAAAAHLPGDHRPVAAVLRGQPVHLHHGQAARSDAPPIVEPGAPADLAHYADPLPQALVLTAIVIGFATTALFLVVLLASRGLTGTDHVDGREPERMSGWLPTT